MCLELRGKVNTAGNNAYSLSMNRTEMYQTTAHEIGHNLDADHPTASNCSCGTPSASVMCQGIKRPSLWFCSQSITEINTFLATNNNRSLMLGGICGPTEVCFNTTVTVTIQNPPSSFTWGSSSNLSLISASGNTATFRANTEGTGRVSIRVDGVEVSSKEIRIGNHSLSISGPSVVHGSATYTATSGCSSVYGWTLKSFEDGTAQHLLGLGNRPAQTIDVLAMYLGSSSPHNLNVYSLTVSSGGVTRSVTIAVPPGYKLG